MRGFFCFTDILNEYEELMKQIYYPFRYVGIMDYWRKFGDKLGVLAKAMRVKVSPLLCYIQMRMARLELAWREPHAPQACVSTDSTTSAYRAITKISHFLAKATI